MAFHGLFIGIDRYASRKINWLNCAKRDAVALHALFTDTLGGKTTLLVDENATRAGIQEEFQKLEKCGKDDVVVIAFSGHGSETHELVTYDADCYDLAQTAIPLDELTDWFSRIPARQLICILDCCFSGGMGAKVLQVDITARSTQSTDELLEKLSGEGRLILTASSATQPAWEKGSIGHGLLTHYLIQALQGSEEVVESGKVVFYRVLDFVTQSVTDAAKRFGKQQNPTFKGKIDQALAWPLLTPGVLYGKAFPELASVTITTDIQSLEGYGFPTELLNAWAGSIPQLNQLQIDAINEYHILEGDHLVVSAPTSSGKTLIGELAALKGVLARRRTIFLLPLKALVNDKYRYFNQVYKSFGLRTIHVTGDTTELSEDMPALMRGQYDICLMTYEKFTAMVLGCPYILEQAGTIVVDEVQMIADASRGLNLEFILTLLRMRLQQGIEPQLIALSAVIGDTNGLERWLGARLLRREERPVPLDEGIIRGDGSFRYIASDTGEKMSVAGYVQREPRKGSSQDWIIPLVRKLVKEGKQVIVFREQRGEARGAANYLAESLGLPPAQEALDALPQGDLSQASDMLRKVLSMGIAFHISDLSPEERVVVEEQFRAPNSKIRVIAATTTLAMGINTPAEAVIIAGLQHPGPQPTPYSIAEYKNIIGRAGRLGYTKGRGASFVLATDHREEHQRWTHYVMGTPEDLQSQFLTEGTDPRSLIVRVLVAAKRSAGGGLIGLTAQDIINFMEGSFGAFQKAEEQHRWNWNQSDLSSALEDLEQHDLIVKSKDGLYQLTELGWLAGQGGIEVESIIRVVDVLRSVDVSSITDPALLALTQLTAELDNVYFPINKRGYRKELGSWASELQRQGIVSQILDSFHTHRTEQEQAAMRAKKAAACLLWITDTPLAEVENILARHGGGFGGVAEPIRSTRSRTQDILPVVARVAEIIHEGLDLSDRIARLSIRLEVGAPFSVVEIAEVLGSRLTRADYLVLNKIGMRTIENIEKATDEDLLVGLGGSASKLSEVREALLAYRNEERESIPVIPLIPMYEG